jgi:hypothetical protein
MLTTDSGPALGLWWFRHVPSWLKRKPKWLVIAKLALFSIILFPSDLAQIRAKGGDDAVQLARFLRLAEVWGIIMAGSALALAAAVIQLVFA